MLKFNFHKNWVNLIMPFISTVECRVQFNSEESKSFKHTRGFFIFMLVLVMYGGFECTEGLMQW